MMPPVREQRWLRIIPVALIMYTISYVDRTNIALALDPKISTMMRDLGMDDDRKGYAAGIFFLGYLALQIPGSYWAARWSARKIVSIFLVSWGICAVGCGLANSFAAFCLMRFLLGVAESGVFPATLVLLANWFPRAERARANAYWSLCQPLALIASAPVTSTLIGAYGWRNMIMLEGALPFLWLPIWWYFIRDHPREAHWISKEERAYIEETLQREAAESESAGSQASTSRAGKEGFRCILAERFSERSIYVMLAIYFLHNCAAYGCMTFFTTILQDRGYNATQYGFLFAVPYVVTAVLMVLNSWHSDKTLERRGHVAAAYLMSGVSLILSVSIKNHFWLSFALMCLAIPGPFAAMAPFWATPAESLPRRSVPLVFGLVNAFGNVGGFAGTKAVGWLKLHSGGITLPFNLLAMGMIVAGFLAFLLPATSRSSRAVAGEKLMKLDETIS